MQRKVQNFVGIPIFQLKKESANFYIDFLISESWDILPLVPSFAPSQQSLPSTTLAVYDPISSRSASPTSPMSSAKTSMATKNSSLITPAIQIQTPKWCEKPENPSWVDIPPFPFTAPPFSSCTFTRGCPQTWKSKAKARRVWANIKKWRKFSYVALKSSVRFSNLLASVARFMCH